MGKRDEISESANVCGSANVVKAPMRVEAPSPCGRRPSLYCVTPSGVAYYPTNFQKLQRAHRKGCAGRHFRPFLCSGCNSLFEKISATE